MTIAQWVSIPTSDYINAMEEIQKATNFETSYSYLCHYTFTDQITEDTLEEADGFLIYNAKQGLMNFHQVNFTGVQTKDLLILCDTLNQQILLQKPTKSPFNNREVLNIPTELQEQYQVKKCIENELTKYELSLPEGSEYAYIRMSINKKKQVVNYQLVSATTVQLDAFQDENKVLPVMNISFRDYEYGSEVEKKKISTPQDFFSDANMQKSIRKFAEYEIIDLRNNK
jgi:hypothetical protein